MSFLNNQSVTIDAVLTKKGRELMARNDGSFQITQFALADDEIDYTLYNPSHPSGSAFFGEAIEKMPLLQAFTDDTQNLKYKLVTLPRGTSKLPVLNLGYTAITLRQSAAVTITPQTLNYLGANSTFEPSGYLMTVGDSRFLSTFTSTGIDTTGLNVTQPIPNASGTSLSQSAIGTSALPGATITTTITCTGRDSGARVTIPLTIIKT